MRFQRLGLPASECDHALDAVYLRLLKNTVKPGFFFRAIGHNQFAALAIGHVVAVEKIVELPPSGHAQLCL